MAANSMNLDAFVDLFARAQPNSSERPFCWILGAGASVTSGIPAGGTLARLWFDEIYRREGRSNESEKAFTKRLPQLGRLHKINLVGCTRQSAGKHYSALYDYCFRKDPARGFAELEAAMADKDPGLGYTILAHILTTTRHRVVITTNFDNLVADAITIHTRDFPFVCGHESLAGYVRLALARPIVLKIHRDLLLAPKNRPSELRGLPPDWKQTLQKIFEHYTPIVIGYDGNDGTLMAFLEKCDQINQQFYWCHRLGSRPSDKVKNLVSKRHGCLVGIEGFDELLVRLNARLQLPAPLETLRERFERRAKHYGFRLAELERAYRASLLAAEGASSLTLLHAIDRAALSVETGNDWWNWALKAQRQHDIRKRGVIYRNALRIFPDNANLIGKYARFLMEAKSSAIEVERQFRRAKRLDSSNIEVNRDFADFLHYVGKHPRLARQCYQVALERDPNNITTIGNYANFLASIGDFIEAEHYYRSALSLNPNDSKITGDFASFVDTCKVGKDAVEQLRYRGEAERLFLHALELDPTNPDLIVNFAAFLGYKKHDISRAESYYRLARKLRGDDANIVVCHANFHRDITKDLSNAAKLYNIARRMDPKSANVRSNYKYIKSKLPRSPTMT